LVEHEEGSLEGRGKDELLPRRGNPFSNVRASKGSTSQDDQSDIYPIGEERSENPGTRNMKNEGGPRTRPREDGGMRAVGPPLPEDLFAEAVPPPKTEPELPPHSTFDSEPRYSTLGETSLGSNEESLPPFLRTRDEEHDSASESLLVSDIRINWLRERADQLELRIGREIDNPHLRKLLQDQLNVAGDQNIRNREQFDEAERVINEVENRINLAERVRAWSASVRMRLILLEIAFAVFIIIGLIFLPDALTSVAPSILPAQASGILSSLDLLVNSMLWGGLGGVFSALIGLQTHKILEEDVDRNWAVWYIATPFMGFVMGAFLFLIVRAALLLIFPSTGGQITSGWIIYLVSGLVGFQQNFAYEIVERIIKALDRRRT
jgi:hypothetical protein